MKSTCLDCGLVNVCSGWRRNTPKRCRNYFREVVYSDLVLLVGRANARRSKLSKSEEIRAEIIGKLIYEKDLQKDFYFVTQGNAIYYRPKTFSGDFQKFKDLFIEVNKNGKKEL